LQFRLGAATHVELTGEYSRLDYEESPTGNESFGGGLALIRDLSESSFVSLTGEHEKVEFDEQPSSVDYDRTEATLAYQFSGARMQWLLEGGGAQIDRDGDKEDEALLRVRVRRKLSAASTVQLELGRDVSDSGALIATEDSILPVDGSSALIPAAGPVTTKYGRLSWSFIQRRTGLGFGIGRFEDRYDTQSQSDRDRTEFDAFAYRILSGRTDVYFAAEHSNEDFTSVSSGFDETAGTAGLTVQLGVRFSVGLEYQYVRRNADDALADEYTENRGWLRVYYGARASLAERFAPDY
ncbi:MAG: hypothetical protein ABW110_02285, partial [Steroidobacteraceae bacterium]